MEIATNVMPPDRHNVKYVQDVVPTKTPKKTTAAAAKDFYENLKPSILGQ